MSISARFALLAILSVPTAALADEAPAAPVAPAFSHLGADGRGNELGADLGLVIPTEEDIDGQLFRLQLGGQGVDPRSGFGGYGSIAMSGWSGGDEEESDTAFGNLEVGGLYRLIANPEVDTTFRVGLSLPTGSEDSFTNPIITILQDPTEIVTAAADVTTLRLAATPTWHRDQVYARADVGLDVFVAGNDGDEGPFVHADFAFGYAPAPIGGAVELVNVCTTDDSDDRCLHLIGASAQLRAGNGVASVGLSLPFGAEDFEDFMNIEAGFRARF